MNDIKEKEQLPIVPLATFLLSRESGQTDGRTDRRSLFLYPPFFLRKGGGQLQATKISSSLSLLY
jgi:hypothetical protein